MLSRATMILHQDHLEEEAQRKVKESKEASKRFAQVKTKGQHVRVRVR
jgi:hypothetical protein